MIASEKPLFVTPDEIMDPGKNDPQGPQKPLGGWPAPALGPTAAEPPRT